MCSPRLAKEFRASDAVNAHSVDTSSNGSCNLSLARDICLDHIDHVVLHAGRASLLTLKLDSVYANKDVDAAGTGALGTAKPCRCMQRACMQEYKSGIESSQM